MGSMTCRDCRRWWSPYLDSELDATKTFEVSEHLRMCDSCRVRFEREARVDGLIKARLGAGDEMPDAMWARICEDVRRPRRPVFRVGGRGLAMAASVVLLVSAGGLYWRNRDARRAVSTPPIAKQTYTGPTRSVADLLREATPRLAAFDQPVGSDFAGRLDGLCRNLLGASVTLNPTNHPGHDVQLIDVRQRTDDAGTRYVELRVNCCGKPVLLAMSERGHEHAVREFQRACARCPSAGDSPPRFADGVTIQTIERDGVIVTGAAPDRSGQKHLSALLASIGVHRL